MCRQSSLSMLPKFNFFFGSKYEMLKYYINKSSLSNKPKDGSNSVKEGKLKFSGINLITTIPAS